MSQGTGKGALLCSPVEGTASQTASGTPESVSRNYCESPETSVPEFSN